MRTKRLAWFSPHPIHYNNYLFESLSKSLPIDIHLIYFRKVLSTYPWKREIRSEFPVHVLNKTMGIDWKLVLQFTILNAGKCDFVVVAGWAEATMILLLTYFRLFKKPYILYTDTPNIHRKKNIRQWLRQLWLSWVLSGSRTVLVTGELGSETLEKWGADPQRIHNFPFATDLDFFSPSANFPTPFSDPLRIFASGRLDIAHKGYDTAIRALALLKQRRPEIKFTYTVAGTGPDEELIRKLIADHHLASETNLVGWLETDELLRYYRESDLMLHTAVRDPFPNAVLEAMACGLVVVGSDSSGSVLDRIENRVNGLVHRTNNVESVFECLDYLANCTQNEILKLRTNAYATSRKWGVEYNISVIREILSY